MLISIKSGKVKISIEHDLMFMWYIMTVVLTAFGKQPL